MDENKKEKLVQIGYVIHDHCGVCVHGNFFDSSSDWGVCRKYFYEHLKHSDSTRQLSITKYGWCPSFEGQAPILPHFGAFEPFRKKV